MERDLPFVDEHDLRIDAEIGSVWAALLESLEMSRERRLRSSAARLLGCSETSSNHLPLEHVGATTPGFTVTGAVPHTRLALRGRHRFSEYALEFELQVISPGTTSILARTRAVFPGRKGRLYRRLVIGLGLHVAAVNGTLRAIARRATSPA